MTRTCNYFFGLGAVLAELRRATGLTQAEVAKRVGVTTSTVSKYELSMAEPNYQRLGDLLALFGVTPEELAGRLRDHQKARRMAPPQPAPTGTVSIWKAPDASVPAYLLIPLSAEELRAKDRSDEDLAEDLVDRIGRLRYIHQLPVWPPPKPEAEADEDDAPPPDESPDPPEARTSPS